jgi:hypothetical protein
MNRRTFVAVSAGAIAVTATNASAGILGGRPLIRGEQVRLSGLMQPAARGPGHYFVFAPDGAGGPGTDGALVFPADARAMRSGKVTLEGTLYRGKFKDETTGQAAASVLANARLV